ncbi:MAG: RNase P modulator RnpM [Christensenellales bacterium]
MKQRKIPMRMCVGCREMKPKRELIRIVRTEDGSARLDRTSKLPGRGAYICPQAACVEKAVKIKALERALERPLPSETVEQIKKELQLREC